MPHKDSGAREDGVLMFRGSKGLSSRKEAGRERRVW